MAMFSIFLDDRGTHDSSRIAVAAGALARTERMRRFNKEWQRICTQEDFGFFHMADFASRHSQFRNWEEPKRAKVIGHLRAVIKKHFLQAFIVGISKRDFDRAFPEDLRKRFGMKHYTWAVRTCLSLLSAWRAAHNEDGRVQYVLDRPNEGKGELAESFEQLHEYPEEIGVFGLSSMARGYAFQDKREIRGLQAADIFAWMGLQRSLEMILGNQMSGLASECWNDLHSMIDHGVQTHSELSRWFADRIEPWYKGEGQNVRAKAI